MRVVNWTVGDHSVATCRALWEALPTDDRKRGIFSTNEYISNHATIALHDSITVRLFQQVWLRRNMALASAFPHDSSI
jgi:hypothetical protein